MAVHWLKRSQSPTSPPGSTAWSSRVQRTPSREWAMAMSMQARWGREWCIWVRAIHWLPAGKAEQP